MTNSSNQIAQLILTRFCHDIAGLTGAIMNGAELVQESLDDTDFINEAANALATSARHLTFRLKLYRAIFGTKKQDRDFTESQQIVSDYLQTLNNITLTWNDSAKDNSDIILIKMLASLIMTFTFKRGGIITIKDNVITATGESMQLSPELQQALQGNSDNLSTDSACCLFLYNYAKESGYLVSFHSQDNCIICTID